MHKVHLKGADPEKVAKIMGGTLIIHNVTDDIALISGGDIEKLKIFELEEPVTEGGAK